MSKSIRKVLCWFGLHQWRQSRELKVVDLFPPPWLKYDRPTRYCIRCQKKEHWLPGYGGSEIGCWCPGDI